jgi:hypothetical protein
MDVADEASRACRLLPWLAHHPVPAELVLLLRLDDGSRLAEAARGAAWEPALRVAAHHRLVARLGRALEVAGVMEEVPPLARARLQLEREGWERRYRSDARPQLQELLRGLAAAEVRGVLLKGAALVAAGVVDPSVRPMADIDVLVPRARYPAAVGVVRALGYHTEAMADEGGPWELRGYHSAPFVHPDHRLPVELHWQLMRTRHRLSFDVDQLEPVRTPPEAEVAADVLAGPDQLAHLCLHFWYDRELGRPAALGQLWDIRDVLEQLTPAELDTAVERADRRGHGQVLRTVLAVCELLLGWPSSSPRLPPVDGRAEDEAVRSFAVRRILSPRPAHVQLLMVTPDVEYTAPRVLRRVVSHLRRPAGDLRVIHGPGSSATVRARHLHFVLGHLVRLLRDPVTSAAELRLDRWAHELR